MPVKPEPLLAGDDQDRGERNLTSIASKGIVAEELSLKRVIFW